MKKNITKLLGYLKNYKINLLLVFTALLTVALSLLQLGTIFKNLVDQGLNREGSEFINYSMFLITFFIFTFAGGSFFRSYFINLVTEKVINQIKIDSYKNLLKLEIAVFEDLKVGDIISRLTSDLDLVSNLIVSFLSFFIRNTIMLVGASIMMFWQSPKLTGLVFISMPILLIPILYLSKKLRNISRKVMAEKAELASFIEESFTGIRTLYAFNQQNYSSLKFNNKVETYIEHAKYRLKLRASFFAFAMIVIAGSITAVIWIGSIDIINGNISSGQMISFIYYSLIAGVSAGGLAELFSEIQSPLSALERIFELDSKLTEFCEKTRFQNENAESHFAYRGNIIFQDVIFSYPARPDILALDNIGFTIKQNQFTGIVGKSGSGKSTIMQLLLGFYNYNLGKILCGEKQITQQAAYELRKITAYAPQDPIIFSGTIRTNIMFSNPDASLEDFLEVVSICGIDGFSNELPQGLDTEIGEKGIRLSGGQRQRINIARSLLYKPEILLLDEATSALDSASEKEILKNVRKFMANKTIISIAHRISSIQDADNIIVINKGKVVDFGSHNDLLEKSDIYSTLFKKQK